MCRLWSGETGEKERGKLINRNAGHALAAGERRRRIMKKKQETERGEKRKMMMRAAAAGKALGNLMQSQSF